MFKSGDIVSFIHSSYDKSLRYVKNDRFDDLHFLDGRFGWTNELHTPDKESSYTLVTDVFREEPLEIL